MNDPIYEFQKGKGWVIVIWPVFTMACGAIVRIESRSPNPGEYFSWIFDDGQETTWQTVNGEPKLPAFVENYKKLRFYESLNKMTSGDTYSGRIYVTFVRIN